MAKANHKAPGEMFPELDFNREEPERQQRAGQQAAEEARQKAEDEEGK